MKNELKFILSVISIILSSVLVLTGCMTAIAAGTDTHPYQLSTIPQTIPDAEGNSQQHMVTPDLQEPPVSQEELKAKFSAMYEYSQGDNTLAVISKTYLENYWSGNKVNCSLSIPEVLYIIQDSISIYHEYNAIILTGLSADVSIRPHSPALEQQTIHPNPDDRDQARADVRKIIAYRLQALSSPQAFFTVAEMMEYRKIDLETIPDLCQEVFFYIPNYSADTNRDLYLSDTSYSNSRSKMGVFCFAYFNRIVLFSSGNPETVFPIKELSLEVQADEMIYLETSPDWILDPEYYDTLLGVPSFVFNPREHTFYITTTGAHFDSEKNCIVLEKDCPDFKKWPGTYEKIGNRLYLYPFDIPDAVFVFEYGADGSLSFNEAESNQMEITFEDKSIYQTVVPNP